MGLQCWLEIVHVVDTDGLPGSEALTTITCEANSRYGQLGKTRQCVCVCVFCLNGLVID